MPQTGKAEYATPPQKKAALSKFPHGKGRNMQLPLNGRPTHGKMDLEHCWRIRTH